MSVSRIGKYYHYNFIVNGRRYRATTKKTTKQAADKVERDTRMRLESTFAEAMREEEREQARKSINEDADEYFREYQAKHRSAVYAKYALGHVKRLLGDRLVQEITPGVVRR